MRHDRHKYSAGIGIVLAAIVWFAQPAPTQAAEGHRAAQGHRDAQGHRASKEIESEQLAILRSDAPAAEKALACKRLAIDGSAESVPDLAELLHDPQLASWARIALEAIPGDEADAALLTAAGSLQGKLLVGAINSIGVRRHAQAVDFLSARLADNDAEVACAAAVALGHIADAAATKALREALAIERPDVRSAVTEGCVLCAERLQATGDTSGAAALYDEIRNADVPKQRILEATRGAILARGQEGIPLLVEQLRATDKEMFELGLITARELPGSQVDAALAEELGRASPERAALMILAMADRPQSVNLAAILKAASEGPKPARIAALGALGRVGDDSCLAALLEAALEEDADVANAAKSTLAMLPGKNVDDQIVAMLAGAKGAKYPVLISLVGQRRIAALEPLRSALGNSDKAVRAAALTALGETVNAQQLSILVAQVLSPKDRDDAAVAQKALKAASVRMPDREACAAALEAAYESASAAPTKGTLLEILAAVGGTKALETLGGAAKSRDPQLQDVSSRLLGEWMTADAAPVLLDLAKTAPGEKYQTRALRGYIRIARQFDLPIGERAQMCRQALDATRQAAEKKLVLDVLKRYPSKETLALAAEAMNTAELQEDALAATMAIAEKLAADNVDIQDQFTPAVLEKLNLEIVKAEYGADANTKDVTEALRKLAAGAPVIVLAGGYNATLGGDPAPSVAKTLKIQYKLNGKPGEATFNEDAVIVLGVPK